MFIGSGIGVGIFNPVLSSISGTVYDITTSLELPEGLSYSGNSGNGTYIDSSGNINDSVNNQPRFNHDYDGNSLGILREETRSNLVSNPKVQASGWSALGGGTETDLSLNALGYFDGMSYSSNGATWHRVYAPFITYTASTEYAITLYVRAGTSGNIRITHRDETGSGHETFLYGALDSELTKSAENAGTIGPVTKTLLPDGSTYLIQYIYTPDFSGNGSIGIGPESTTVGETVILLGVQIEEGSFPTSFIPTQSTRDKDRIFSTSLSSIEGYSESSGTLLIETDHFVFGDETRIIAAYSDNSTNNRIGVYLDSDGYVRPYISAGGTGQASVTLTKPYALNKSFFSGITWSSGTFTTIGHGGYYKTEDQDSTPAVSLPTGLTRLDIGCRYNGSQEMNGHFKKLFVSPEQLSIANTGTYLRKSNSYGQISAGQSLVDNYRRSQVDSDNGGEVGYLETVDSIRPDSFNFLFHGATGGSALLEENNGSTGYWVGTTPEAYTRWVNIANHAKKVGTVDGIIWDQGTQDAGALTSGSTTRSEYKTALQTLFSNMRSVVGNVPIFIVPIGARGDGDVAGYQIIREIQQEMESENSYVHLTPEKFDLPLDDSVHLDDDNGYYVLAKERVSRKVLDVLGETVSGGVDGPSIISVTRSGATITITISHDGGTDYTPASGIEGFKFFHGSNGDYTDTEISFASAVNTDESTITITLNSTPTGDIETLYYGYQSLYNVTKSNLVIDNSDQNMPLRSGKFTLPYVPTLTGDGETIYADSNAIIMD
jgi:hypothetical protein